MRLIVSDPWIAAQIDEVVAPYIGRLPAREVAWIREQLLHTLASDETAALLLKGARPREVDQSGELECEPGVDEASAPPASRSMVKPSKAG